MLPGYQYFTEDQHKEMWSNCTFIVDANFVLNLYRYEESARNDFLKIFSSLGDRLWLPFYAAIEFQRNRPKVIADQKKKFSDVRKIVAKIASQLEGELGTLQLKKRHNLINTDKLISEIKKSVLNFTEELEKTECQQIDVHQDTELRGKIESIFNGKIGKVPTQEWMTKIASEGEQRYINKIPPGYCDIGKGKEADPVFFYGDILFERKYGDLIIWNEILDYSRLRTNSNIIFLTDDAKEDWWWIIDSGGEKRLGPRPELIEEMIRSGNAKTFYIYSPEQFLHLSRKYLNSSISDETIDQAREISSEAISDEEARGFVSAVRSSVERWILSAFNDYKSVRFTELFPDVIMEDNITKEKIGIEHIPHRNSLSSANYIKSTKSFIDRAIESEKIDKFYYVIAGSKPIDTPSNLEATLRKEAGPFDPAVHFVFGNIEQPNSEHMEINFVETFRSEP